MSSLDDLSLSYELKIGRKEAKKIQKCVQCCGLNMHSFDQISNLISKYNDIKQLNCACNDLKDFDFDINNAPNIENLNISENYITSFRTFQKLKKLICSQNHIVSFDGIETLHNLEKLYCDHNHIRDTFGSLEKLRKLIKFDCAGNGIKDTFSSLGNLCELRKLYAYNNNIYGSFLPLKKLENLEKFDCTENNIISENFDGLQFLSKLRMLDCEDNHIKGSFVSLMNLKYLTRIICGNNYINSMKGIPLNIDSNYFYFSPNPFLLRSTYYDINIVELSGTAKFQILVKIIEEFSSFFFWLSGDKNNLNKLYDYF